MTVKEELERQEHRKLNPLAAFSDESRGRPRYEQPREEDVRTCYQRDIDRIVHSDIHDLARLDADDLLRHLCQCLVVSDHDDSDAVFIAHVL